MLFKLWYRFKNQNFAILFPCIIFFSLSNTLLNSQPKYIVDDFSEDYFILGTTKDLKNIKESYYWEVFSKVSGKKILEVGDELLRQEFKSSIQTHIEKLSAKNVYLPFINTYDFNFDGNKDLVVLDNYQSKEGCYNDGGTVYLTSKEKDTLIINKELTNLYSETYCYKSGGLKVNTKNKTLETSVSFSYKDYSEEIYTWEKGIIKKIKYFTVNNWEYPFSEIKGKILINSNWKEISYRILDEDSENISLILSFEVENGKGRVILFSYENYLFYTFLNPESHVEFAYPTNLEKVHQKNFSVKNDNLSSSILFNSGSVRYSIYEDPKVIGIYIFLNGKKYFWKGNTNTKKGTLKNFIKDKYKNVL